jgi:hypothetical protein
VYKPPVSSVLDSLGDFLPIPSCNQCPLSVKRATRKICNFHTFFLATCNKLQKRSKVIITTDVKFSTLCYMFIFLRVWDVGLDQLESPSSAVKVVTMQLVLFSKKLRGSMGLQAVSYCWYLLLLFSWAKSITKSSSVFTSAAVKPNTKPVLPPEDNAYCSAAQIPIRVENWKIEASTSYVFQ